MHYLLDTNTGIAVMRNNPKTILRMSAVLPGDCGISTISSYELFTGVAKCSNPIKEQVKIDLLLKTIQQIPFEPTAEKEAGRIRAKVESQGQPIGPYDYLLAGQAIAFSQVLVSANTREFSRVPGLILENWQN